MTFLLPPLISHAYHAGVFSVAVCNGFFLCHTFALCTKNEKHRANRQTDRCQHDNRGCSLLIITQTRLSLPKKNNMTNGDSDCPAGKARELSLERGANGEPGPWIM